MSSNARNDIIAEMQGAIQKYNLTIKNEDNDKIELLSENCVILLVLESDKVSMMFTNPKEADGTIYNPWTYTNILYGFYTIETQQGLMEKKWSEDQATMCKNYGAFFNKVVLDYFEPVISGDYSWKEKFVSYMTEVLELVEALQSEPEWEPIAKKYDKKDLTWIEDARELYNQLKK